MKQLRLRPYYIPWAMLWAVGVHSLTATGMIFQPEGTKEVIILVGLDVFINAGIPVLAFVVILYLASASAAYGLYLDASNHPNRRVLLTLLAPQYFLVTVGLVNDAFIVYSGEYNGREINHWVLAVALGTVMVMALFHNASVIERYFWKWYVKE